MLQQRTERNELLKACVHLSVRCVNRSKMECYARQTFIYITLLTSIISINHLSLFDKCLKSHMITLHGISSCTLQTSYVYSNKREGLPVEHTVMQHVVWRSFRFEIGPFTYNKNYLADRRKVWSVFTSVRIFKFQCDSFTSNLKVHSQIMGPIKNGVFYFWIFSTKLGTCMGMKK
jgi:hypothetical protein